MFTSHQRSNKTRERMRNEDIRQELKVAELREKIRECRLRWYGHVKRMEENEFVRWSAERSEPGTRRGGRPRKRWMDCVRDDGIEWWIWTKLTTE